jgi:hypothetical protein
MAVKMPVGTLLLILASFVAPLCRKGLAAPWRDELVLISPALVLFVLVSSQTGFNSHLRYVLPTFPYLFVSCAKLARRSQKNFHEST